VAKPDEQLREIGETKKELAERHVNRQDFWKGLLERSRKVTRLSENRSPSTDHWLAVASGRSGLTYNYLIIKSGAAIDLYIDVNDGLKNKVIFDELYTDREAIESEFGAISSYPTWNK